MSDQNEKDKQNQENSEKKDELEKSESASSLSSLGLPTARSQEQGEKEFEGVTDINTFNHQLSVNDEKEKGNWCPGCRPKKFRVCAHGFICFESGVTNYNQTSKFFGTINRAQLNRLVENKEINIARHHSIHTMFSNKLPRQFMLNVKKLSYKLENSDSERLIGIGQDDIGKIASWIQALAEKVGVIFENEQRVVRVTSPAYVVGDIFGNLNDLMIYERMLWNLIPSPIATTVFLGNYVDVGNWGVECVLYLFCLKIIAPNRFFFCRGRHEFREMQSVSKVFQFTEECTQKYGQELGSKIFKAINKAFDKMPYAVIIDESFFCCNSGIPMTKANFDNLQNMNMSENENTIIQLTWNEPITVMQESKEASNVDPNKPFQKNLTQFGYCYNEQAVKNFLKLNELELIIRGNEMDPKGHRFLLDNKVLSLSSCSRNPLINEENEPACLLIDNDLKILILNTKNIKSNALYKQPSLIG